MYYERMLSVLLTSRKDLPNICYKIHIEHGQFALLWPVNRHRSANSTGLLVLIVQPKMTVRKSCPKQATRTVLNVCGRRTVLRCV